MCGAWATVSEPERSPYQRVLEDRYLKAGRADSAAPMDLGKRARAGHRGLYIAGAAAALLAAVVFRRNWSAEVHLLREFGLLTAGPAQAPGRASAWYALLQSRPILGLVMLDFVDVINYALVGLVLLALHAALRRVSRPAMTTALAVGLVGVAVSFGANHALDILTLSSKHAAATTAADRTAFLIAGEALLALDNPGTPAMSSAVAIAFFLVTVASLIASVAMLRSTVFARSTAWVGIVAHLILLGRFLAIPLPPAYAAIPPSLSAPLLIAWNIMIAKRLIRLARTT